MKNIRLFEGLLYTTILLVVLCVPFFVDNFSNDTWSEVWKNCIRILPFIVIFLINNYLLVSRLLFAEKYRYYFSSCILLVVAVVYLNGFLFNLTSMTPPFERPYQTPPREADSFRQENMPPPNMENFQRRNMPPPDSIFFSRQNIQSFDSVRFPRRNAPPPNMPFPFSPGRFPLFFNIGLAIISFLLIGFNTGVKSFVRWSEEKIMQAEKDRQYYYTELAFLKHQISPHFFMNTLNNIHALVDINAKEAKNAIIKLSNLMRYLLYESDEHKVSLNKEIDFIESYIELMRLRYDEDNLKVETEYPDRAETIFVPSSLFLSFIENAFKHGVHPHTNSLITIRFSVENGLLTFRIVNYCWNLSTHQTETTGIGLENVRKRLDLIYRNNYTLDIQPSDKIYIVTLKIPVS